MLAKAEEEGRLDKAALAMDESSIGNFIASEFSEKTGDSLFEVFRSRNEGDAVPDVDVYYTYSGSRHFLKSERQLGQRQGHQERNNVSKSIQLERLLREEEVLKAQLRFLRKDNNNDDDNNNSNNGVGNVSAGSYLPGNHEKSRRAHQTKNRKRQTLEAARSMASAFAVEYPFNMDLREEKTEEEMEKEKLNEKDKEKEALREQMQKRERESRGRDHI